MLIVPNFDSLNFILYTNLFCFCNHSSTCCSLPSLISN